MVWRNRRVLLTDIPTSGDNPDDSSQTDDTNFDGDMVVMLAALLCALVAALLLNSVVHLLLRRRRQSMEAATSMQASGLEKRVLKKIPVARFRMRTGVTATECTICLGDFVNGEKVRVLPECNHEFHVKCVDKWLTEHASCPNCRRSLVPHKVVDGGDQATVRAEQGGVGMV